MFTQNKKAKNSENIDITRKIGGISPDGVLYYPIKKEDLLMNIEVPHQNFSPEDKKSIIKKQSEEMQKGDEEIKDPYTK